MDLFQHYQEQLDKDYLLLRKLEDTYRLESDPRQRLRLQSDIDELENKIYNYQKRLDNLQKDSAIQENIETKDKKTSITIVESAEAEMETLAEDYNIHAIPHLWSNLSSEIIILFGVDSLEKAFESHKQYSVSPNDLNALLEIYQFLTSIFHNRKRIIAYPAFGKTWADRLPPNADLVLIGGFVTNSAFENFRNLFKSNLALRMGRVCHTDSQEVYHIQFEDNKQILSPEDSEDYPTERVIVDHGVITKYKRRKIFDSERTIITIAGIKGTGTLIAAKCAIHDQQTDMILSKLESIESLEISVSGNVINGRIENAFPSALYVNNKRIDVSDGGKLRKLCELGKISCEGCSHGAMHSGNMRNQYFTTLIIDLDDTILDTFNMLITPIEYKAAKIAFSSSGNWFISNNMNPESFADIVLQLRRRYPNDVEKKLKQKFPNIPDLIFLARKEVEKKVSVEDIAVNEETLCLLERLKKKYHIVLLTQGDREFQERKVMRLRLSRLFHKVEIVTCGKKDFISQLVSTANVEARRVVVIGNRIDNEIRAGNECGCTTIRVSSGEGSLMHASGIEIADKTIDSFFAVEYALRNLRDQLIV